MQLKLLFLGLIFGICVQTNAQSTGYFIWNVGYTNLNGNYFETGVDYYLISQNDNIIDFGATANLAYFKDEFVVIPEASIGYLFNFNKDGKSGKLNPHSQEFDGAFWMMRTSISPYHITPEVGVSVLSLIEFSVGYGFEFAEHDQTTFDGLKLGLNIKLPFGLF